MPCNRRIGRLQVPRYRGDTSAIIFWATNSTAQEFIMSAHRSFIRNAFDRLIDARMRQAEREIALHHRVSGEWSQPVRKPTL